MDRNSIHYEEAREGVLLTQHHPRNELHRFTEIPARTSLVDCGARTLRIRLHRLLAVLQICDQFFQAKPNYLKMYARNYSHAEMVDILRNISIEAEQTILTCRVNGVRCKQLFTETVTDEGICFTFNGYSSYDMFRDGVLHDEYRYLNGRKNITNWSQDAGFVTGKSYESYPIRALGSGFEAGLSMRLMMADTDVEEHCREQQGFKIILHSPREYPQARKRFILVSYSQDVTLAVRPIIYKTSSELSSYPPKRRNCFFNHERPLKFFRIYSQSNCELECVTNFTLKSCGCVKFSMPRSKGTRVCQTSEIACVILAENKMLKRAATNRLKKLQSLYTACDCIPGCNSIQYDAEITQTKCDFKKTLELRLGPEDPAIGEALAARQISKLAIYFKDTQFITLKRSELFGTTDFIADCGGILGLCLGVSLFSLVELLYYCMVRPVFMVRDSLRNKRTVTVVKEKDKGRY
ncbi:pickpocket protein 28-like [Ochlerotatus camptorhynchus]|uniref:pickpocket protein 28-like n=1 Tax=Ochlerotatus camptorhynchus TaxID=644619 RepID=UPI0031D7EC75